MPSCFWPTLLGIVIKKSDDVKAACPEAAISQQSSPQIAQTNQSQRPVVVDSQDMPQGLDELRDAIANPWVSELTEKRQVFTHLRVLDRKGLAELAARDRGKALSLINFELPEERLMCPTTALGAVFSPVGSRSGSITSASPWRRMGAQIKEDPATNNGAQSMSSPPMTLTPCHQHGQGHSTSIKPACSRQDSGQPSRDMNVVFNLRHLDASQACGFAHHGQATAVPESARGLPLPGWER